MANDINPNTIIQNPYLDNPIQNQEIIPDLTILDDQGDVLKVNILIYLHPLELLPLRSSMRQMNHWVMKVITSEYGNDVQKVQQAFKEWLKPYKLSWILENGVIGQDIKLLRRSHHLHRKNNNELNIRNEFIYNLKFCRDGIERIDFPSASYISNEPIDSFSLVQKNLFHIHLYDFIGRFEYFIPRCNLNVINRPLTLRPFGENSTQCNINIFNTQQLKDDYCIKARNNIYLVHIGDNPPEIAPEPEQPALTTKQAFTYAMRKWVRYSFHHMAFEWMAGTALNFTFKNFMKTCGKIMLFILLYPVVFASDFITFLIFGILSMKKGWDPFNGCSYPHKGYLEDIHFTHYWLIFYRRYAIFSNEEESLLNDANLLHKCALTNRKIVSPARVPNSDILYEEVCLEDFIKQNGRDPEGNPCTVADIITDNVLRYRISGALGNFFIG